MNHRRKNLPRGIIPLLAKKIGLTKQGVYQRLKRNDEYTLDLLEKYIAEYLEEKKERRQRAKFKYELILKQIRRLDELS